MNAIYPSTDGSWQGPASRVVRGMRLVDAGVTVKDRILLHLLDYWGQMHRAEWPVELTQDGIAGVVGISRSHVAVTLPDLIDEDMVDVSTQRVEGRPRRVKVYGLSFKGGAYAGRRAQELLVTEVTAVDDTGEWPIPLDGLIQVHKVHMLTVLRLVDEENRVDLRRAEDLAVAPEEAVREAAEEAAEGAPEEIVEEAVGEATGDVDVEVVEEAPEAAEAAAGTAVPAAVGEEPSIEELMDTGPVVSAAGDPEVMDEVASVLTHGMTPVDYRFQQPFYYSPLRFGTGRSPSAAYVATMLVMGFVCLMTAVALFGLSPGYCAAAWVPLVLIGAVIAWSGFKSMWALGPRREVWTAAALGAYMTIGVTMVAFAAFGQEVVIDLMWASLVLGVPSLVLVAGTGRSIDRRGSFMLLIGPVMVIAAVTMAVLDPGEMGRTAAMPLFIVMVGVMWAFVGWLMVRPMEDVEPTPLVVAGGSIGLAIAALAGAGNLAAEDALSPIMGIAVVLWVLGAAYVAIIMLVPSLAHMRPDDRMLYISLAVAGAAALLTAAVFFIWGGLMSVAILEAVIAVGMMALVAPDMREMGAAGRPLMVIGVLMASVTVLAVALGL